MYSSDNTSLNAIAIAAIVFICGPPCNAGNRALSTCGPYSFLHTIRPALGPLSILCVVEVITSACGKGCGCSPVTHRPAI